ncbi:MAG: hypothetical protein UX62_C0039G0015 [Microgenomates group bacterium GW2011_GWA2_46_7]|nr:MAG: hypothetical protein UX62_C0039G0015 [Microgenomates group bacterium GW2011_GWA2_46_7]KKU45902.1 MAG: hypothetical protein UX64_C0019G0009 [Microgenomates group bacterium GW2011_GWC2_46_7]
MALVVVEVGGEEAAVGELARGMWQQLQDRLSTEKAHFDALGDVVKHLLTSYSLYLISYPILGVFINAYFWRQTNDITLIAAYNFGFFIALPVGFYLNGLLLRHIHILRLYWLGMVLQGIAAFLVIFFPTLSFDQVLFYGLVYGVGSGLFWGNKNYITLKLTKGRNRLYYNNFESVLEIGSNIVMPLLMGWFIVFGQYAGLYSINTAYKILMIGAILLMTIGGYLLQSADIYSENIDHITVKRPSANWNLIRLINIIYQSLSGINFIIPNILILMFVGTEGILGTVESVVALVTAMMLYLAGRKSTTKHFLWIVTISSLVFLVGMTLYNLTYGYLGALIYTVSVALTGAIAFNPLYTVNMEIMDQEKAAKTASNQYAYIFDNQDFRLATSKYGNYRVLHHLV